MAGRGGRAAEPRVLPEGRRPWASGSCSLLRLESAAAGSCGCGCVGRAHEHPLLPNTAAKHDACVTQRPSQELSDSGAVASVIFTCSLF